MSRRGISTGVNSLLQRQTKSETIPKWLKDSGFKVNESKTKLGLFQRKYQQPITINLNNEPLKSKTYMKVLGVKFNCKLNWQVQIENSITKAKKALNATKLIQKYLI